LSIFGTHIFRPDSNDPIHFKSDGITVDNAQKKVVHAWREMEKYVRYMINDNTFDLATAWKEDEHKTHVDITNPFKKRTSARIEFAFTGSIEDIEAGTFGANGDK